MQYILFYMNLSSQTFYLHCLTVNSSLKAAVPHTLRSLPHFVLKTFLERDHNRNKYILTISYLSTCFKNMNARHVTCIKSAFILVRNLKTAIFYCKICLAYIHLNLSYSAEYKFYLILWSLVYVKVNDARKHAL